MVCAVTIGIPCYNSEKTLLRAVRSVLSQPFKNVQVIVVDDGSSDNSLAAIGAIRDSRCEIVSDTENRGLAARLNQIAWLAEGRYLFRMDADDVMHPDRIVAQLASLEGASKPDLVCANMWLFDGALKVVGRTHSETGVRVSGGRLLENGRGICHPTVAGKVEWFRENAYNERMRRTEDLELWLRTLPSTKLVRLDIPLHFYGIGSGWQLDQYRTAMREQRQLVRAYGPAYLGTLGTVRAFGKVVAKEAIAVGAGMLGAGGLIDRRRVAKVGGRELEEAQLLFDSLNWSQ